jgi:S-adenosylmethionine synthetase
VSVKNHYNLNPSNYFFTSESVAPGHPDKLCDQISDAILDAHLARDSKARVAIETFAAPQNLILGGEVTSESPLTAKEIENVARLVIKKVGYTEQNFGWDSVKVTNFIHGQSPEIAVGVLGDGNKEEGAGDQGIMFGYACNETPELMPAAIHYANKLIKSIIEESQAGNIPPLGPDGKSQVTLQYAEDKQPKRADTIVISIQHPASLTQKDVAEIVKPIASKVLPEGWIDNNTKFFINPTGSFIVGGPASDTGLTGRKIIVDTYGGYAPHGGGAFSGKDPSKVDRSAAYAVRYLAKNLVASGIADKCLLQISYAIGVSKPLSIFLNTFGTSKIIHDEIVKIIPELIDLSPRGIRNHLKLDRPIYSSTSTYGHFGRESKENGEFSWEKTDLTSKILELL